MWSFCHFGFLFHQFRLKFSTKMAFILGVIFRISDTRGPIGMKLWGYIELTLRLCNVIFSTSGRKSKPEVSLPHTILVLFRHEILPDDRENDLESNELCTNIGKTGNTGKNRILVIFTLEHVHTQFS